MAVTRFWKAVQYIQRNHQKCRSSGIFQTCAQQVKNTSVRQLKAACLTNRENQRRSTEPSGKDGKEAASFYRSIIGISSPSYSSLVIHHQDPYLFFLTLCMAYHRGAQTLSFRPGPLRRGMLISRLLGGMAWGSRWMCIVGIVDFLRKGSGNYILALKSSRTWWACSSSLVSGGLRARAQLLHPNNVLRKTST